MERWSGIPADGLLTMPITLAVPLDLPDVRVLAHRMLENGTVLIEVESTLRTTQCHRCGRDIRNGPQLLGSGKSEISRRFQAARSRVAYSKYTASGVCPSSAL